MKWLLDISDRGDEVLQVIYWSSWASPGQHKRQKVMKGSLKHNCTQIRGEQTTGQGDELYSFFGHSSIVVPYLVSSMAFASLLFYHPYAGAILIFSVSFQFQLLTIFNKSRSSLGRPWIEQTNKGKSNHWSTIVPYWTFGHHMDTSVGQHWTTLWKTLHPIKQVKT